MNDSYDVLLRQKISEFSISCCKNYIKFYIKNSQAKSDFFFFKFFLTLIHDSPGNTCSKNYYQDSTKSTILDFDFMILYKIIVLLFVRFFL